MMTKVYNLEEIPSSIPPSEENPRRFNIISNHLMLVDLDKALVARTFNGQLVFQDEKDRSLYKPDTLIEIFWSASLSIVTRFTPEVKSKLIRFFPDEVETPSEKFTKFNDKNSKLIDDGKELPYNERKALPSKDDENKKENEAWN